MKALILLIVLFFAGNSYAVKNESIFHFYGALGELYNPASFRLGHKQWEIGKLNQQSYGLAKLLYKGNIYGAFGLAYIRGLGVYGGMGIDLPFWHVLSFRAEINGTNSFTNYSHGEVLVGLTFYL